MDKENQVFVDSFVNVPKMNFSLEKFMFSQGKTHWNTVQVWELYANLTEFLCKVA